VRLESRNGRYGWAAGAPYDRLIAWCSVITVPRAWVEQTRPAAILVVPRRRTDRQWIGVYRRTPGAALVELERLEGGFVPLTAAPYRPWER
jgi:protein-L-isoaspartate O-methyltransferase